VLDLDPRVSVPDLLLVCRGEARRREMLQTADSVCV
jgi:hypothetical protein